MLTTPKLFRRRARLLHAWLTAVMCIGGSGCGGSRPVPAGATASVQNSKAPGATAPLMIAAASDLQLALPQVSERFREKTGIETTITFGASGQLAQQIKQGAPFDLFLSANEAFVQDLATGGFITRESVASYARGSLVLAVYQGLEKTVRSVNDLTSPEIKKIAVANPATAPYGKAGKQALERAGIWEQLQPKIVIAESVRQALLYAQKGDADAALVGRAIARVPEIRPVEIDPGLYDPIVQALGVVSGRPRPGDAQKFASFVLGDEGQSILHEFGFEPPKIERGPEADRPSPPRDAPGTPRR
jgi:molybdate transport system substrate-binding protein